MFRVEDLLGDFPTPVFAEDGDDLKVYDKPKYSRIVDRYQEDGVRYVVVMFDHPDNPPSNSTRYLYLAP